MSKPYREIQGVKISNNGGKNWRTVAICNVCFAELEPPTMAKKEGVAGVRSCDWCGCGNITDKPAEKVEIEQSESVKSLINAISHSFKQRGEADPFEDEGLPPNEVCNLDVAYSPIIPIRRGKLKDAVEAIKIKGIRL